MKKSIKVGDRIRTIGKWEGLEGTVTRIVPGIDVEEHGTVEFRIEKITNDKYRKWLTIGDLEHFVHFEWWDALEIINN